MNLNTDKSGNKYSSEIKEINYDSNDNKFTLA